MDDYEMDEAESSGLDSLYAAEEEGEETANITSASSRGALMFGAPEILSKYGEATKEYETSIQEVLRQMQAARDKLLNQPTEQSRGEQLRGIAMALAAPRERDDPRFYERRNLYTFLRDIGEYGAAQKAAQKKAEEEKQKQISLADFQIAQEKAKVADAKRRELAGLAEKYSRPERTERPPANVQEVQYYESILASETATPEQKEFAKAMLKKLSRIPAEPVSKPNWNEQVLAARMRVKEGKGTPRDLEIIAMSERGQGGLTTAQARMDKRIRDAQAFLNTINERERAAAFAAPYPNERQQKIRKAAELAGQPLYEDVAKGGDFSAVLISDDDET